MSGLFPKNWWDTWLVTDALSLQLNFSEYFGYYENPALFPPTYANLAVRTYWAKTICETSVSVNQLCSLFQLMWTGMEWEGHLSPKLSTIIFTHFPNGMSTKLIVHMSQVLSAAKCNYRLVHFGDVHKNCITTNMFHVQNIFFVKIFQMDQPVVTFGSRE